METSTSIQNAQTLKPHQLTKDSARPLTVIPWTKFLSPQNGYKNTHLFLNVNLKKWTSERTLV